MLTTTRLTKRQKKGVAFRERKHGKRKGDPLDTLDDETNVPSLKDQAPPAATQDQQGCQVGAEALVGRGEAGEANGQRMVVAARKRKRKTEEEKGEQPKLKRRMGPDESPLIGASEAFAEDHVGVGEAEKESEREKQRFILFLGNLRYTTTADDVQAHFSVCVPPPTVRLLTPKPSTKSLTQPVAKSKGCAFLEFKHRGALQQGLKLHHSQLDGRQINVELTVGGGGKGATRTKKLKERNKELEGQRRKQHDPTVDGLSGGTQRSSVISGAEQTNIHKRIWTTGGVEDRETHRGGQKHQKDPKKRKSLAKDFRTGVNAIPIG